MSLYAFEKLFSDGAFIGIFGALRSGKTLMAVRLATLLARERGYRVVSNIPVTGGERVTSLDAVAEMRRVIFLWDEVQVSLDARAWSSEDARALTQDMILWGKRGIITLYTSPAFATVDVRLRRLTQHVYVTRARLKVRDADYASYAYFRHPLSDDVLVFVTQVAVRLDTWYGHYDTLYGLSRDDTLALAVSSESKRRRS